MSIVTALMCGCTGHGAPTWGSIELLGQGGGGTRADSVLTAHKVVIFVCGCQPCHDLITRKTSKGKNWALISSLGSAELGAFCRKAGWDSVAYQDRHDKLAAALGVTDCPRAFSFAQGQLKDLDLRDLEQKS